MACWILSMSYIVHRCIGDPKVSMMPKSPGPRSRGPTSPTSPLHPRLCPMGLESPTGKQEDGKSVCHPLPLPPGSPTSPFALPSSRPSPVTENTACALSKWKKGKLLGRGTFGHVYVGFNRWFLLLWLDWLIKKVNNHARKFWELNSIFILWARKQKLKAQKWLYACTLHITLEYIKETK